MTTNYDPIAEQYQRSKQQPWRVDIECFTLLELLGDVSGLKVLDVACGEGFYSRLLRRQGADKVVGVDLSQGMINLARQQESQHKLGVEYMVGDARQLPVTDQFDLVVAAYLLNYAQNHIELQAMCDGIAKSLRPGGRFVTVNTNPALDFSTAPSFRQYGFETGITSPLCEGTPITWTFHLTEGPFSIENYHLTPQSHEAAFRRAGFRQIEWHAPRISTTAIQARGSAYWSTFLDSPPVTFIECLRE